jgi:hypothetical protein
MSLAVRSQEGRHALVHAGKNSRIAGSKMSRRVSIGPED